MCVQAKGRIFFFLFQFYTDYFVPGKHHIPVLVHTQQKRKNFHLLYFPGRGQDGLLGMKNPIFVFFMKSLLLRIKCSMECLVRVISNLSHPCFSFCFGNTDATSHQTVCMITTQKCLFLRLAQPTKCLIFCFHWSKHQSQPNQTLLFQIHNSKSIWCFKYGQWSLSLSLSF